MPAKANKVKVWDKLHTFMKKYKNMLICDIKDLSADIIHKIRKLIRGIDSEALCGKSTVMMKSIEDFKEKEKGKLPFGLTEKILDEIRDKIQGLQVMLIFTNRDISEVSNITEKFIVAKDGKPGQLSPIEVIMPAGPTGMDSSQIEYFQALKIPTKVVRNQLEITSNTKILAPGQKITLSEINLMKKFNIKPFHHHVKIQYVCMSGKLYDSGILKVTPDYMKQKLEMGIKNILQFSLASGVPTKASAPYMVANAFRNICSLSLGSGFEIPQTKGLKEAPAAPKKEEKKKEEPKKEEKKKEEKKKEPEPEEDDDMLGGLF